MRGKPLVIERHLIQQCGYRKNAHAEMLIHLHGGISNSLPARLNCDWCKLYLKRLRTISGCSACANGSSQRNPSGSLPCELPNSPFRQSRGQLARSSRKHSIDVDNSKDADSSHESNCRKLIFKNSINTRSRQPAPYAIEDTRVRTHLLRPDSQSRGEECKVAALSDIQRAGHSSTTMPRSFNC